MHNIYANVSKKNDFVTVNDNLDNHYEHSCPLINYRSQAILRLQPYHDAGPESAIQVHQNKG
jgi:hypothetical protein